jgi:outer membrane receptor protein involved in Fe transport
MRTWAAASLVALVALVPCRAAAQERIAPRPTRIAPAGPVVSVAAAVAAASDDTDDVTVAAQRFADELSERLRPIEDRLRNDVRLRRAGAIVGLSAAAVGAIRGQHALTFAGTQALRLGLDRQLTAVRARSGFSVEPAIGHRSFSVTVTKNW